VASSEIVGVKYRARAIREFFFESANDRMPQSSRKPPAKVIRCYENGVGHNV